MGTKVLVLVGTKLGGFILESDAERKEWEVRGPFCGVPVRDMKYDPATGTIYATGAGEYVWGEERAPGVYRSRDLGETWTHSAEGITFGDDGPKVTRVWHLMPGNGVLYAGAEPAGLFRSTDGGETWSHVAGLREHPTTPDWHGGNGGLCLHSIALHPSDPNRIWVAMSAVGTFYTGDGGKTWEIRNQGMTAQYPIEHKENIGYCVHKLVRAPGEADILYQQHHGGVFRSPDGGLNWENVAEGLPSDFGFPCVEHPHNPEAFYVLPVQDNGRYAPGGAAAVWRAEQGGKAWTRLSGGLPQEHAYFEVLREGMAVDTLPRHGIYFGTNNGFVFGSGDEGENWQVLASHLPYVWSVNTAVIED